MKSAGSATSAILDRIQNCIIDSHGIFKYIQIQVKEINDASLSKYVVRGYLKHKFHADNFDDFSKEIENSKDLHKLVEYECVGGGRININKDDKTIFVYGYSQSYGQCNHQISCDILKQYYPDYTITWSNEGY
jgi:phosphohistidine phosphatase